MPDSFEPLLGDKVNQYCLLTNGHDGSTPVTVRFTPIRVVCQNTLTAAINGTRESVSIRHTDTVQSRIQQAAIIMRDYRDHFARLQDHFAAFAEFRIDDDFILAYEDALFGKIADTPEGAARTIRDKKVQSFESRLYMGMGTDIHGVIGTAWGAYNAATEWADYEYPLRSATDRTESLLFGSANKFKQTAFDSALALVAR